MDDDELAEVEIEEGMLVGLVEGEQILVQLRSCVIWQRFNEKLLPVFTPRQPMLATYAFSDDCCEAVVPPEESRICPMCLGSWMTDHLISQVETPASMGLVP
jgi:hypothetical protein